MTRRIIAVSSLATFGEQIAALLDDTHVEAATYETLVGEPDLWVIDRADRVGDIPGAAPIVVVGAASLAEIVEYWQSSDRIAGFARDGAAAAELAARVLQASGLAGLLAPSTEIHERSVGDHDDKLACLAVVSAAAEPLPEKLRASVEQCTDELVMNALYAAPVDAAGARVFANMSVRARAAMRTRETVRVAYAIDAKRFVVGVRDAFGTLDRATLLRVLYKGVHGDDKIDRRAGGAGLGTYLVASAASAMWIDVVPGVETSIVCVFDRGRAQPPQLAFVTRDPDGRARTAPVVALRSAAARRRTVRRAVAVIAAAGLAAALVASAMQPGADAIAIRAAAGTAIELDGRPAGTVDADGTITLHDAGYARHFVVARRAGHLPRHATVRAPATVTFELALLATIELDSQPSGATVEHAGVLIGTTPLTLTTFVPAARETLVLVKPGYRRATVQLTVPAGGQVANIVEPLVKGPELVRARITSNPPGAAIVREGEVPGADRTYTPADVYIEAGKPARFTLVMAHHAPLVVEATGTDGETVTGELRGE